MDGNVHISNYVCLFTSRFQMSGKNMSNNLTPILYDYSEEELMASIEKEYS